MYLSEDSSMCGLCTLFGSGECRELVVRGSFVGHVPVFLVYLATEYYVFTCPDLRSTRAGNGFLYVMYLVLSAGVTMSGTSLRYDS
jgi:hypothetical protein